MNRVWPFSTSCSRPLRLISSGSSFSPYQIASISWIRTFCPAKARNASGRGARRVTAPKGRSSAPAAAGPAAATMRLASSVASRGV